MRLSTPTGSGQDDSSLQGGCTGAGQAGGPQDRPDRCAPPSTPESHDARIHSPPHGPLTSGAISPAATGRTRSSAMDRSDMPTLRIVAWLDPIADPHGVRPCSRYVELYWLPVIGPPITASQSKVSRRRQAHSGPSLAAGSSPRPAIRPGSRRRRSLTPRCPRTPRRWRRRSTWLPTAPPACRTDGPGEWARCWSPPPW